MRRHDIRFPLRGRVWAAVPFFCACPLRREWATVPFFLCPYPRMGAIRRAEHGLPTAGGISGLCGAELCGLHGTEPPVCAGRNVRPEWNGTSGLRGGAECPVGGGGLYGETPDHAPQVSRAEGGMSRSADGDSRRRAGSGSVFWSARRARKGFRETGCIRRGALAAASRAGWKAHPGVGGKTKSGFREKTAFVV